MDALSDIPLFEGLTQPERQWLIAHSTESRLAPGEYFFREGEPQAALYVVLDGELQVTRTVEGEQVVLGTTPRGNIGGEIGLLTQAPALSSARAIVPSRLRVFDQAAFRQIFGAAPAVGERILNTAVQRMAGYVTSVTQQEKLAALGKLSAGLAHELNNPAAATRRAASSLHETLAALQETTLRLCALELEAGRMSALEAFQRAVLADGASTSRLNPVERSDREGALGDWLDQQGVAHGWEMAPTFVAAGVTVDALGGLIAGLAPAARGTVLAWLNAALCAAGLVDEIEHGTQRIHELVSAVKAYTYMDKAALQAVDVHQGLDNTLTMLGYKLKAITLTREYDPNLPRIMGHGGELNQVWTNLLDNAVDALDGQGQITLITRRENEYAMIEIADNGPGIPPDVLPRIFEPFFSTKGVGMGSGLGLDIAHRIVRQHRGTVEVQSRPGHTRFIIRLPIDGQAAQEPGA